MIQCLKHVGLKLPQKHTGTAYSLQVKVLSDTAVEA